MDKRHYSCEELQLPYEVVVKLRNEKALNLGIDQSIAVNLSTNNKHNIKNKSVSAALHFWSWVGFLVFAYTVYLSFTGDWWWFIVGGIILNIIWKANKQGNAENILDEALANKEFYNKVLEEGGWLYEVDADKVHEYLR
jgi:hypothetical protein